MLRRRFRSWKDAVIVTVLLLIYLLLDWAIRKYFPQLPGKAVNVIVAVVLFCLAVALLLGVEP